MHSKSTELRSQGEHKPSIRLRLFTTKSNQALLLLAKLLKIPSFEFLTLPGDFNNFESDFQPIPCGTNPNLVGLLDLIVTALSFN